MTLPPGCDGLSVLLLQVFCPFRRPSMCRPVHRQLMRNELHNFTTIVPVTVYHQGSYVETYSRFKAGFNARSRFDDARQFPQRRFLQCSVGHTKQLPLSPRRNGLPVKLIDWSRLMIREYATRALIELMQIGPTPSSTDPVLHHAPEAFNRIEVVSARSR